MNHIISINLNFVASATTISRRNIHNSKFVESIVFSLKWIINRQSFFKKTMIKFKIDIKNFRRRYFQLKAKTSFSMNNISLKKKLSSLAFKISSRFLKNVYNKFKRDRNQSQFTSTNSLNLSSVSEVKDRRDSSIVQKQIKQLNIFEIIDFFSISEDRSRFKNVFSPSIKISAEKIIYDHFIDSQLKNMTSLIENVVIQTTVNAAINQDLKNMMNKI